MIEKSLAANSEALFLRIVQLFLSRYLWAVKLPPPIFGWSKKVKWEINCP